MIGYILRRLLAAIPTLLAVLTLVFLLVRVVPLRLPVTTPLRRGPGGVQPVVLAAPSEHLGAGHDGRLPVEDDRIVLGTDRDPVTGAGTAASADGADRSRPRTHIATITAAPPCNNRARPRGVNSDMGALSDHHSGDIVTL